MITTIKKGLVLLAATASVTRQALNARYRRMSQQERESFHSRYAKIFRKFRPPVQAGYWTVDFLGKAIRLPLSSERMWLDWDTAVSIVGHDAEVKQTYEHLLQSNERPNLFFDVGANYGTHTLLLASQGIRVVAFEPNQSCIQYAMGLAAANNFQIQWEHVAIGDSHGTIRLFYPERETWLGSVSGDIAGTIGQRDDIVAEEVRLVPLDDYYLSTLGNRVLIKIDVEGLELSVLKGAQRILKEVRPMVIFEANRKGDRAGVFKFLALYDYAVFELPWLGGSGQRPLSLEQFIDNKNTNFLTKSIEPLEQ